MDNVNKSFQNQLSIQISDCDDSFSSNGQSQCTPIKSQNSPSLSEFASSAESSFRYVKFLCINFNQIQI